MEKPHPTAHTRSRRLHSHQHFKERHQFTHFFILFKTFFAAFLPLFFAWPGLASLLWRAGFTLLEYYLKLCYYCCLLETKKTLKPLLALGLLLLALIV
jgi:hypothetical protein